MLIHSSSAGGGFRGVRRADGVELGESFCDVAGVPHRSASTGLGLHFDERFAVGAALVDEVTLVVDPVDFRNRIAVERKDVVPAEHDFRRERFWRRSLLAKFNRWRRVQRRRSRHFQDVFILGTVALSPAKAASNSLALRSTD